MFLSNRYIHQLSQRKIPKQSEGKTTIHQLCRQQYFKASHKSVVMFHKVATPISKMDYRASSSIFSNV